MTTVEWMRAAWHNLCPSPRGWATIIVAAAIGAGAWAMLGSVTGVRTGEGGGMFKIFRRQAPSLDEQFHILEECGIRRRPGVTMAHLTESWGREEFEKDPFWLAVVALGGEREQPPYERLSDDVWHFDTECIEDHGSYTAIAERMRVLAQGDLPITAFRDHVDIEEGVAWLEFELEGQKIRWEAEIQDDWVDPTILSRFADLLASRNTGRRFTYLDLKGQDCIIGCCTAAQLAVLRRKTGLDFVWLS